MGGKFDQNFGMAIWHIYQNYMYIALDSSILLLKSISHRYIFEERHKYWKKSNYPSIGLSQSKLVCFVKNNV